MQQFTAVVFDKDELEFRGFSELKSFLPLLAFRASDFDAEIIFEMFGNEQFAEGKKL